MVIAGIFLGLMMIVPFAVSTIIYALYYIITELFAMCGCEDCCGCCGPPMGAPYGYAQNH